MLRTVLCQNNKGLPASLLFKRLNISLICSVRLIDWKRYCFFSYGFLLPIVRGNPLICVKKSESHKSVIVFFYFNT